MALVVGALAITPTASAAPPPWVPQMLDGLPAERGAAVVRDLVDEGVVERPEDVLWVGADGVGLRGNPNEAWIDQADSVGGPTQSAAKTNNGKGGGNNKDTTDDGTKGGGGKGGGGKGGGKKSDGGGGTIIIGDGGGGSSSSYNLIWGPGLLDTYTATVTGGTPTHMVDGFAVAVRDAASHSGSNITFGSTASSGEPLNGEMRLSAWDTQICGFDQAAGCALTWWDGTRVLKSELRIRTWVPSSVSACIIGHELGHGLGLAHVDDASQLMNPVWSEGSSPCTYQNGDQAGLAMMGSLTSSL